jgi:4-amino-4-deoxy-L-arabinose transferase-like glycosyltransferase
VRESPQKMKTWKQLAAAMLAGLALRLFFIAHFPFEAGDTKFYEELARNWLTRGVYGIFLHGQLIPVDMRVPGYPAFLAAVHALGGQTNKSVMVVQALIDLATCLIAGLIAARIAPAALRRRAMIAAVWLAALCPFTANYTAVMLTEVLATFLTTLAVLILVCSLGDPSIDQPLRSLDQKTLLHRTGWWLLAGFVAGLGTLVRPETPIVLAAVAIVLSVRWWRRTDWPKLALAGLWMGVGLLLALAPWAARNARTLGRADFLAPRYAETEGAFIPRGFYQWTQTWMVQFREAYLATWKLGKEPIPIDAVPGSAFDSEAERARVEALLSQYNADVKFTPMLDREFADLARERTSRHPVRIYVFIPMTRAWVMWFTPRVEFLRYSGELWPPGERWRENRTEFAVTAGFGILGFIYAGLALVGAWRVRSQSGVAFLATFVILRTALLTQLQTVEARYVIVCFPLILALGALALVAPQQQVSEATERTPAFAQIPPHPVND